MTLQLALQLPDFEQDSTIGRLRLHTFLGTSWGVFLLHSRPITPAFVAQLRHAARIRWAFDTRNVKLLALCADDVDTHRKWGLKLAVTQGVTLNFPVVADREQRISALFDSTLAEDAPIAVTSVLIIDPCKTIRAAIAPPTRHKSKFQEVLRVIDTLQSNDHRGLTVHDGRLA